ncbi:Uncharacterised protein [Salmonella enterica subsp. enterica]|nr:Uncharacterised protein [Salmonella enterica subsp. enterica]
MNNKLRYFFDLHQICLIEKTVIFCWFELATSKTYDKTDKR